MHIRTIDERYTLLILLFVLFFFLVIFSFTWILPLQKDGKYPLFSCSGFFFFFSLVFNFQMQQNVLP